MTGLGNRNRASKKPSSNPYAERGLDEFAVVSAKLEAKRERLVAQLGSPFSLVRFESASDDSKWIPIISCPTLSKAEIEAATHLTTVYKPARSGKAHEVRSSCSLISGENIHSSSLTGNEKKDDLAHAGDVQIHKIWRMPGFVAALQRFLWIASFSLSVVADIVCDLIMPKWHVETVPKRPSQRSNHPKEESFSRNNPSAAMASSTHVSPLPAPAQKLASLPREVNEAIKPPHVEASEINHGWKTADFSTAPRKPGDSRQITKKFRTSVSLPKTFCMQDQASHMGITKDIRLRASVSLPKTTHLQQPSSHKVLRRSTSYTAIGKVPDKERKGRYEKLGQALTGAGLVLGLCCLEMGFILAIAGLIACWWYALPSLRKVVGDKSSVKTHHQ